MKLNILRRSTINKWNKLLAIVACFGCLLIFLSFRSSETLEQMGAKGRPNVIIILADDLGYGDVGFNGCKDIPTPNIDRIAKNGVVFNNAYVTYAVCAPSRAGLITGRYQDRFGYSRNPLYRPFDSAIGIPLSEQLLPELLQKAGYKTMGIGKWHLGTHEKFRPWNRGFDEYFGFIGGGHRYFPSEYDIAHQDSAKDEGQSYRTKLVRNNQVVDEKEYLTDALSREAVSFVNRNAKQPFFMYLAYNAPHSPLQATQKYLDRFAHITNTKRRTYAAMVSAVDDGVGALLQKLAQLKISENTIVIFLSDNGGPEQDNASDNGVLRAGKGSLYEGGIRVPFAMQWPAQIKAGTLYNESISALDIFATVSNNVAGASRPKNQLDGVDLIPYLKGVAKTAPHEYLFWRQFDQKKFATLHLSGAKNIVTKDTTIEMFDIRTDIAEQQNRYGTNTALFDQLEQARKNWLENMIPPAFLGLNQEAEYNQQKKQPKKQ